MEIQLTKPISSLTNEEAPIMGERAYDERPIVEYDTREVEVANESNYRTYPQYEEATGELDLREMGEIPLGGRG